jgi:predicted GNAT family acetyltransferase
LNLFLVLGVYLIRIFAHFTGITLTRISMNYNELKLNINTVANRLELEVEGYTAFIDYKLTHQKLFLIHTEVPKGLAGKGVGNAIVEKALQYAKDNNYKIIPICKFVQAYIKKHPEWNEIVSPDADRFIHHL